MILVGWLVRWMDGCDESIWCNNTACTLQFSLALQMMEISITKRQTRNMESNIVLIGSVSKNWLVNFIYRLKQEWWHHDVFRESPWLLSLDWPQVCFKKFLNGISIHMRCVLSFRWVKSGTFWKQTKIDYGI